MAAAEDDLVILEFDASDVRMAHRVKRLVHETYDGGEHRRDEVRIRAGREASGQVHHRDASSVDEKDVVHDRANPGHGYGDLRPEGLNPSAAVIRVDSRMATSTTAGGGKNQRGPGSSVSSRFGRRRTPRHRPQPRPSEAGSRDRPRSVERPAESARPTDCRGRRTGGNLGAALQLPLCGWERASVERPVAGGSRSLWSGAVRP